MRWKPGRRFSLVVDEDVARLDMMKTAVEAHAFDTEVLLVDPPEGRAAITFAQNAFARPRPRRHTILLLRADPVSWTIAAVFEAVRACGDWDRVDLVVAAEGRPETLPVLIADLPALRVVSPRTHPCAVVAALIDVRWSSARSS
ncbi:hypothetical protein ACIPX0_45400 [Streptomyces sp. NPDC090075]|uniref:hypothetical protein n=1 Tax=Streptomyces sp. NPDC090075 TaxID=3365937 RepID=UPI0038114343